jgi:hypothetical protein
MTVRVVLRQVGALYVPVRLGPRAGPAAVGSEALGDHVVAVVRRLLAEGVTPEFGDVRNRQPPLAAMLGVVLRGHAHLIPLEDVDDLEGEFPALAGGSSVRPPSQ